MFTVCATVVSLIVGLISPTAGVLLFLVCGFVLLIETYAICVKKYAPAENAFAFAFIGGMALFLLITLFITYKVGERSIAEMITAIVFSSLGSIFG